MCLGDSVTFGTFTPPYNWPNFLEEIIRSKGIDVEVINASTPGNTYTQLVERFEEEYIEFKPDILLIYKDFRSGDILKSSASIEKIKSVLGYKPAVSVQEGIRKTIQAEYI